MNTDVIALTALILVILVIVYLFLGRIISNMWPNSKANKFFGGIRAQLPEREVITNEIIRIHNEETGTRTINLENYLRSLPRTSGRDILYAITQLALDPNIDYNYTIDILRISEAVGLIDPRSDITRELRNAIDNPVNGRVEIPDDLIRSINNRTDESRRLRRS